MMKSFRNLILSLFLAAGAAGFAACDGTTGPAGVAGPAGAAGATGAKGDTGAAGESADEIKRDYAYLKTWGIDSGMAACSDPALTGMDPFPGPDTLTNLPATGATPIPPTTGNANTITFDAHAMNKGECSDKVFSDASNAKFVFTAKQGTAADRVSSERTGTTSLGNGTVTTVVSDYYGGTVAVNNFAAGAAEIMQRELLFTRCDVGKRPSGNSLMGDYRIEKTLETESLRGIDPTTRQNITLTTNQVKKYTTRVCVRFSAPGTVKCYERVEAESRNPSNDNKASANPKVTERIVLYKNGQYTPVPDPMPYSSGLLAGIEGGTIFPFGANPTDAKNLGRGGKLCNLFDMGVNPCPKGEVPDKAGACS